MLHRPLDRTVVDGLIQVSPLSVADAVLYGMAHGASSTMGIEVRGSPYANSILLDELHRCASVSTMPVMET